MEEQGTQQPVEQPDYQNQPFQEGSGRMKFILVIVTTAIITAIVVGGIFLFYPKTTDENINSETHLLRQQIIDLEAQLSEVGSGSGIGVGLDVISDWQSYKNNEYGFQLELTSSFKEYKAVDTGSGILFKVPSIGLDEQSYVDVFFVGATPVDQWVDHKDGGPGSISIGRNNDYVFYWTLGQDPAGVPQLLRDRSESGEVWLVAKSFQIFLDDDSIKNDLKIFKDYTNKLDFSYPSDFIVGSAFYTFGTDDGDKTVIHKGIWTPEAYENRNRLCTVCTFPNVLQIRVEELSDNQSLEEFIINYLDWPGNTLQESLNVVGDQNVYEYVTLGSNEFIKVIAADLHLITYYYIQHEGSVLIFSRSSDEVDTLEQIISSLNLY
jgi:hypothetical protein